MSQQIISLKNQKEFDAVNRAGKKFVGKFMIVVIAPHDTSTHLGLKVGRKFGNAIMRNKFKRRIRAIVYDFSKIHTGSSFIIIPKSYATKANYQELLKDFHKICKSAIA